MRINFQTNYEIFSTDQLKNNFWRKFSKIYENFRKRFWIFPTFSYRKFPQIMKLPILLHTLNLHTKYICTLAQFCDKAPLIHFKLEKINGNTSTLFIKKNVWLEKNVIVPQLRKFSLL